MGSLEDAIRNVSKKYRNVPSPLTEIYQNTNKAVMGMTPQKNQPKSAKDNLLGNFRPNTKPFG